MALTHTLVTGLLPKDGEQIMKDLDAASDRGFTLALTATCAASEDAVYYVATLVKPKEEEAKAGGIKLGENSQGTKRAFLGAPRDVSTVSPAKPGNPQ